MAIFARQSTAIIVTVGPTLDADGVAVTGGVVGDFKISKNGGAPAALNGSATYTHRHTGYGSLSLTASDVDTVGTAEITMDDTVNACPLKEITVVEEAIYDALFAASANGFSGAAGASTMTFANTSIATVTTATNVTTVNGLAANVITATAIADNAIDLATFAADVKTGSALKANVETITAGAIAAASFNADADAEIAAMIWNAATVTYGGAGTYGQAVEDILDDTGTAGVVVASGSKTGYSLTAATGLGNQTADITGTITTVTTATNLTNAPTSGDLTATMKASVNAEIDAALVDIHLDHLLAADYDPASKPGVATALLNEIVGSDAGVSQFTANALELAPTGGSAPTVEQIADAVWDELQSGHVGAGTFGEVATEVASILADTGTDGVVVASGSKTGYSLTATTGLGNQTANITGTITTVTTATNVTTVNGLAANVITAGSIAADAITAAKIADNAIDLATFAADVKTGSALKANVETITAGAITAASIANDAITDAKVAADVTIASVTGSVNSVTTAVTVGTINANVITATAIANDAITDAKVASDVTIASVTGAVGSVTGLTAATVHSDLDDIQARLPAALTAGGNIKADVLAIDGSTTAADRLQQSAEGIVFCTVGAGSTTTSIVTSAMDPAAAVIDQFKGRIVIFDNDTTTVNLRGQATDITASTAGGVLTVTALTTAAVSGDTFTIV